MRQPSVTIKEHVVNQYSAPSRAHNVEDVIKYSKEHIMGRMKNRHKFILQVQEYVDVNVKSLLPKLGCNELRVKIVGPLATNIL
jgi:hypothetical protein